MLQISICCTSTCLHTYVGVYIYIYPYKHVCVCVYIYIYIYYTCKFTHTHTVQVSMRVAYMHIFMYPCIHTYCAGCDAGGHDVVYIHTYMHAIHTYIHTHMYVCRLQCGRP